MIKIKLQGGLGNQMFIYAFAKTLQHMGYEVCLDARIYNFYRQKTHILDYEKTIKHTSIRKLELQNFNLTLPIINTSKWSKESRITPLHLKILGKIGLFFQKKPYLENQIIQGENIFLPKKEDVSIEGYFCNVNYFYNIKNVLIKDFSLGKLSHKNQKIKDMILQTHNSCFLHIRRGDYLAHHNWMFTKLGKTYYEEAIKIICQAIRNPTFFIFSNDIKWCKENFLNLINPNLHYNKFIFIDNNSEGNASEELELMRNCQNAIIANSTFSRWGAFLQNNPSKVVIMPNQWLYYENTATKLLPPVEKTSQEKWYSIDWCWGEIHEKRG